MIIQSDYVTEHGFSRMNEYIIMDGDVVTNNVLKNLW